MKIESTTFGAITIDGTTYQHDVVVRLSGEVVKRKKKLSRKLYGTSHVLSKDEAKFLFEKGCDQVVIGSGQMGNVHLSPEAEAYFERKGCEVLCLDVVNVNKTDIPFQVFDGRALPVEARSYDVVLFLYVLHHAADDQPLLDEARRVLRDGGCLLIAEDSVDVEHGSHRRVSHLPGPRERPWLRPMSAAI